MLDKGTAFEFTKIRAHEIEERATVSVKLVNQNKLSDKGKKQQQSTKTKPKPDSASSKSNFCGSSWHKKLQDCPAKKDGVVCKTCDKPGHFARACLHPTKEETKSKIKIKKVKVHELSEDDSRYPDEYVSRLSTIQMTSLASESDEDDRVMKTFVDNKIYPVSDVKIMKKLIRLVVDSGATSTILNKPDYQKTSTEINEKANHRLQI